MCFIMKLKLNFQYKTKCITCMRLKTTKFDVQSVTFKSLNFRRFERILINLLELHLDLYNMINFRIIPETSNFISSAFNFFSLFPFLQSRGGKLDMLRPYLVALNGDLNLNDLDIISLKVFFFLLKDL